MDFEQCTACGATVEAGIKYCTNCGAPMSAAADDGFFEQSKHYFSEAADELLGAGKDAWEGVKSANGKKIASGAAIGAVAGAVLPVVGLATGAIAGAGIVAYRQAQKLSSGGDTPKAPAKKPVEEKPKAAKSTGTRKTSGSTAKKK
ncbi:zinc ribbon domain-containing protein [Alterisphingorhabdus coralli]|uniref:Zinc ribbon domain-containing protein n=1 Tax=Alterisphingorhabdus coralli TaxID=3071408 RepID=A0AA97F7W1_9SPHN|nr:zinc ribbon domain-containing protein [Parasphingorhabdus sp. SCSIO 66989]WOE75984.1 zinc ribbon domain-containing protein [Parasphingorhabdus sp. SCSIO 66989]